MKTAIGLSLVGLVLAVPAAMPADGPLSGNWRLTALSPTGDRESTSWLVKFDTQDAKTTASILGALNKGKLVSFKLTGDRVHMELKAANEQTFDGLVSKDGKKIVGVLSTGNTFVAAYMAPTTMTSIVARGAGSKLNMSPEEMRAFADGASRIAKEKGTAEAVQVNLQLAVALLAARNLELATVHANAAEQALSGQSPMDLQVKVLQAMARVLTDAGKTAEVKAVAARLEKLEKTLDDEYTAKVPSFKATKFAGRKSPSDRVVVMELFTGAQCPDCPPADVAADVLLKTYAPSELVFLEYHLHIPGADPMVNPDNEARWKYYRDAHGNKKVPGVPTSLFNGTPKGGYGGRLPDAEAYYKTYCGFVTPLLDTPAACKITTSAKQVGDKIRIDTQVAGLKDPGKDKRIRLALVEESIRFLGSNKIRFHHQVVRTMPGGAAGVAVMNPSATFQNEVDLMDLRKKLNGYLDNFAATVRPFPQVSRPLDFHNLRVVAYLQDDVTHEILQAAQVDVVH